MSNAIKQLPTVTVGTSAVRVDQRGVVYHKYASVSVQSDLANTGKILIGDNNVSTTNYARSLSAGDWFTLSGSAVDATNMWAVATVAGQILHPSAS